MPSFAQPLVRAASAVTLAALLVACGGSASSTTSTGSSSSGTATQAPTAAQASAPQPTTAPLAPTAAPAPASGQNAAATAAPAAASTKDKLTIVFPSNQGTLDPHFAAATQEILITRNVFSSLLKYKPNSADITGDLATSWDMSPDGLTYTFKLRQDVEWQKGFGHFTATDVKASFDRLRDPATKSPFAGTVSMLKEVDVVDDYTVKFVLSTPYAAFLQLLTDYRAGPIVNVKAIQQYGQDAAWNPVGTGPYEFVSGVPKQGATIQAFDKYYGDKPAIKTIVTQTVPDVNAEVVGLENGQYDMLFTSPSDPVVIKRLQDEGFVQDTFSRNLPEVLLMNVTVPPFDNLNFRKAVAYAVNRQQIIDLAFPGIGAKPWYSPVPDGFLYATTDVPKYEFDVNKAKQALSDAGFPNGVDVTLNVYDTQKTASDVLSEQLKAVGIRVTEDVLDQPTFISRVVTDKGINFTLHCCVRQPDPDIILSDMFSPKLRGAIYVSHADLESELATARQELDPQKRAQDYANIQKEIMDQVLMVPIAMVPDSVVTTKNLKGMPTMEPLWGLDLTKLSFQ